jgi:hypothetical protein
MQITRNGSRPSGEGPVEDFTGSVRIEPLFDAVEPARSSAALATFEPGARSAWHTHPLGQRLIVISGLGWQIDLGNSAIPKSVRAERIRENAGVFDFALQPDEVEAISALHTGERGGPDPEQVDAHTFAITIPEGAAA